MGRAYWKLWTASTVLNTGGGVASIAFPLIAAGLTRDPALIAGLTFAFTAPWLLFGLVAGAIVDRLDRRRTMVAVSMARVAIVTALAAAVATDHATLALLYATAFLLGAGETLFDNAAQAILPAVVPRERLEDANSRLAAAERVTNEFVGPPLGGLLYGLTPALPVFVDAAGHATSAAAIASIRGGFRPERTAATLWREIAEGLRWLRRHRLLRTLAAMVAVLGLVDAAWFSILVLYALEVLDVGSVGFAFLLVAGGAGSVAGSVATPRLSRTVGTGRIVIAALVLAAVAQLVLGLTSSPAVAVSMLALSGFAFAIWNVVNVSLRQELAPDRLLGRVHSAYRFLGVGATAVGALVGGLVADALTLRAPFLVGVPILLAVGLAALPVVNNRAIAAARVEARSG